MFIRFSSLVLVWVVATAAVAEAESAEESVSAHSDEEQGLLNDDRVFPTGFVFGTATASYQIEGAWKENGKGENIWDYLTHSRPDFIKDRSNGDVACDSYHKYKEDVDLVKNLGVDVYRFSLSWTRLLPTGAIDKVNKDGLAYYNNLITELLAKGIQPMVTLYHWDLPQKLQDLGGWANPVVADYFVDFARFAFSNFGDRVKLWLTFNEPFETCANGYGVGFSAPAIISDGVGDYLCAHTVLRAHAKAYRKYHGEFAASQKGKVGITLNSEWFEPRNASDREDRDAAERMQQFKLGWFAHPIFSDTGDYPPVMRHRVMASSLGEGRSRSRLPTFTTEEIDELKGSSDFFGLNHYSTKLVTPLAADKIPAEASRVRDHAAQGSYDPSWPGSESPWLKVVPWGFRKLLVWIKNAYKNPTLIVTENGFSDEGQLEDKGRISYYAQYMDQLLKALHTDRCNVIGYIAWSLMDNFEWESGYTAHFGLHAVNFTDPARPRTAKASAAFFKSVVSSRRLPAMTDLDLGRWCSGDHCPGKPVSSRASDEL